MYMQILDGGAVSILLQLAIHDDIGVQYASLRVLHAVLARSRRARDCVFTSDILKSICSLLDSSEPDIVSAVCDILLLHGADDQVALRQFVTGSPGVHSRSDFQSSSAIVCDKLMHIASGSNQFKKGSYSDDGALSAESSKRLQVHRQGAIMAARAAAM